MKISLRRRQAQTVKNGATSHKTNYIDMKGIKIAALVQKLWWFLLNGWILSTGGASSGRVCTFSLRNRLVLKKIGSFSGVFLGAFEKYIEILCYFWELFQHFGSIQGLFWAF